MLTPLPPAAGMVGTVKMAMAVRMPLSRVGKGVRRHKLGASLS